MFAKGHDCFGGDCWYLKQEAEANRFAIELLSPQSLIRRYLATAPDLTQVVAMTGDLEISKEAAARRYVETHRENLTAVFLKDGRVKYAVPGKKTSPHSTCSPKRPCRSISTSQGRGTSRNSTRSMPANGYANPKALRSGLRPLFSETAMRSRSSRPMRSTMMVRSIPLIGSTRARVFLSGPFGWIPLFP